MFNRRIEQQNYAAQYPQPEYLTKHKNSHPDSFYIQIIGCRGAGKSTFTNLVMRQKIKGKAGPRAKVGTVETTLDSQFFDLTQHIDNLPKRYKKVFLVDQPGIGGQQVRSMDYLSTYGIGKMILKFLYLKKSFKVTTISHSFWLIKDSMN